MEICDFSIVSYFYCLHLRDASGFSSLQLITILFFFDRRYCFDRGFVGAIKLSPVSKRGGFLAVRILYKCNWFWFLVWKALDGPWNSIITVKYTNECEIIV